VVEDLTTKLTSSIHSTRPKFYHDSSLELTAEILAHVAHQNSAFAVRALRDLKYDPEAKAHYLLVSWLGFEEAESTWEPLLTIFEDLLAAVTSFLAGVPPGPLLDSARLELAASPSRRKRGGGNVAATQRHEHPKTQ
jgi:hypothetical protein